MEEETRGGENDSREGDKHAAEPETTALGEQGDRADDQTHFEESFAAIKAIGPAADEIALLFKFLGLFADVLSVGFVALDFLQIFLAQTRGLFLVQWRECAEHVGGGLYVAAANIFCLIIGPLVGGLRLQEDLLGVGAMA